MGYDFMSLIVMNIGKTCFDEYITKVQVVDNSSLEVYYDRSRLTYKDEVNKITITLRVYKNGNIYWSATNGTDIYNNELVQKGKLA